MADITLTDKQYKGAKSIARWYDDSAGVGGKFYLAGYAGTGKEQPLDCAVQTPNGPKKMGDIQVGDIIFAFDGTPTNVTGVYPQGMKAVYRITFRDGSSTKCGLDHLWAVRTAKEKRLQKDYKVKSLKEIIATGVLRPSGDARFSIPLCVPIDYASRDFVIHPYLMGVLLGDGYLSGSTIGITKCPEDHAIINTIKGILPDNVQIRSRQVGQTEQHNLRVLHGTAGQNPIINELNRLALRVDSRSKFIPNSYLVCSKDQRVALIRGLMDTDGSCRNNRTSFHTYSVHLATGVKELIQSLGGTAIIRSVDRGDVVEYDVNVKVDFNPFTLERKAKNWRYSTKNPPSRYIRSIEYIGEELQQCISIAHPSHLYLTDEYIVTHNTSVLPSIIEECGLKPWQVAFCAPTGKAAKVITGKLSNFYGDKAIVAKTIHSSIYMPARARVEQLREELQGMEEALVAFCATMGEFMNDPAAMAEFNLRVKQRERDIAEKEEEFKAANREYRRNGPQFLLNTDAAIKDAKLIVVDEASMVGFDIAKDLMSFNVPVLAIGDPAQLPPVGDKPGFTVGKPDFFFDEIHRQAADNPIIRLSMDIRNGKELRPGTMGDKVFIVRRRDDRWTENIDYDAQVICGTHKKRWGLTKKIRAACGYEGSAPQPDEPLIVCKNSKKNPVLVNGSFVTCDEAPAELIEGDASFVMKISDENGDKYEIDVYQGLFEEHGAREQGFFSANQYEAFDAKKKAEHVDFAWCITAHKSQGSQYENVIVHDESGVFKNDAQKWLYTSCTRASEELVIVI